jgi:sulfite dehydrogenase (quinone) subunit SoeC
VNPSLSIIIFTAASGAGYGLIALTGLLNLAYVLPEPRWFGAATFVLALALVSGGLISSTFHLGRPERAWRALSQWRSSWLSREGVLAVLTYIPTVWFAIDWTVLGYSHGWNAVVGVVAAIFALATVACTAMIYASLKPIRQWHNLWVLPNYLALSLMSGALWLNVLARLWGEAHLAVSVVAWASVLLAAALKVRYWRFIDAETGGSTIESATGLGHRGRVRAFDPPHTGSNYLLDEMGFQIARKHAARLRNIALIAAFALPGVLTAAAALTSGWIAAGAAFAAALVAGVGVLIERWLFFAEAKHTVTLYYGAARA